MVELRPITEDNFQQCLNLRAAVPDSGFVDTVTYSLAEAWLYYRDTRPFAIYNTARWQVLSRCMSEKKTLKSSIS